MQVLAHLPIVRKEGNRLILAELKVVTQVPCDEEDVAVIKPGRCFLQQVVVERLWQEVQRFRQENH